MKRGFTLIEILIVISLIGTLSLLGLNGFQAISRGGRDALRKTELEKIRSAAEVYKSETNVYPPEASTCSASADLSESYIKPYPADPLAPTFTYCYKRLTNLTYEICAHLENGDTVTDNCGGTTACGANCNYAVTNP